MRINKTRIDFICEKIIEYSLYTLVFFLPTSKSMIEVCATIAVLAWLIKKINNLEVYKTSLNVSPLFYIAVIISLLLLIPLVVVIASTLSTHHMDLSLNTPVPFYIAVIISIIAFIVLAVIMVSLLSTQHLDLGLKIPLLLFIDITIITSMFTTLHIDISLGAFFFKTLEYLLIFFMMAEVINTRRRLINVLLVMLSSSLIVGIDGIYQQITGYDFFRHFLLFADVKVSSTFQFSNSLGTYLATILPIPLSLVFYKATNKKFGFILTALCLLLAICLLLSQARGAWLGFILGFLLISLFSGKKNFLIAVSLLVIIVVLASLFGGTLIKEQFKSFMNLRGDQSANDRMIMWKTALCMFADKPIFGHGLGTFMHVFERFKPKSYLEIVYAHNCYLQMATEIGIFGLLIFLWFIVSVLRKTLSKLFKSDDIFLKATTIGIAGGILAYLVNSFFDTSLYSLPLAVLFWAMSGLAVANIRAD